MNGKKRILTVILAALLLAVLHTALTAACAEDWDEQLAGMMDPYDSVYLTVGWQNMNVSKNTKLPVYSAPYEDAWRGAKGKASVSMGEKFKLLGTVEDGAWGLVDYKVDGKSRRIGWIRMPEGATRWSEYGDMFLSRIPLKVTKNVTLTDDPQTGLRKIRSPLFSAAPLPVLIS